SLHICNRSLQGMGCDSWLMRGAAVSAGNFRAGVDQVIERSQPGKLRSALRQHLQQDFRGDIRDHLVLREWASAEAAKGAVKAPAAGRVGCLDARRCLVTAR